MFTPLLHNRVMSTRGTARVPAIDDLPLELDPRWAIPAMFGGALAAALLRVDDPSAGWLPTEVHAEFHRPAAPGPGRVRREVLHDGRNRRSTLTRGIAAGRQVATVLAGWTRGDRLEVVASPPPDGLPKPAQAVPGDLSRRVDWRTARRWPLRRPGRLDAWIRPRDPDWELPAGIGSAGGALHPAWYLVAGDLLAPALINRGEALRIATVSLQLAVVRLAEPGWIRQSVRATRDGDRATASLELRSSGGELLARVHQSALLYPAAAEEMPVSATGFGWGGTPPRDYINTVRDNAIG
jgi:hypothetical protein